MGQYIKCRLDSRRGLVYVVNTAGSSWVPRLNGSWVAPERRQQEKEGERLGRQRLENVGLPSQAVGAQQGTAMGRPLQATCRVLSLKHGSV